MGDKAALSVITGQVRRTLVPQPGVGLGQLSLPPGHCPVDSVQVLGSGGKEANRRRRLVEEEERRMGRELSHHAQSPAWWTHPQERGDLSAL